MNERIGLIASGYLAPTGRQELVNYDVNTHEAVEHMVLSLAGQGLPPRHWIEALGQPATLYLERRKDGYGEASSCQSA